MSKLRFDGLRLIADLGMAVWLWENGSWEYFDEAKFVIIIVVTFTFNYIGCSWIDI